MKNHLLLKILALLFIASPAISQKLKDKKINVKYISLPSKKLPQDYQTYTVYVYGGSAATAGSSRDSEAKRIKMDGFRRMEGGAGSGDGHLRVIVNTGYVRMGRADYQSSTSTTKDKDGKEVVTTSYWYNVPMSVNANYKILDPKGNVLSSNSYKRNDTKATSKYKTSANLRSNYNKLMNNLKVNYSKAIVNDVIQGASGDLSRNYDFYEATDYPQLYLIKKYDSEDDFEKHYEQTLAYFKEASHTTPASEAKDAISNAMEFWKREGTEDLVGDKKLQRVYVAANFNYAVMSYYLEDFDAAEKYANKVIDAEEGKHRRSENLLKKIAKTRDRMDLHDIKTMRHVRDVANAMGPKEVSAYEEEKEELAQDNDSMEGKIVVNGQEVKGAVMLDKEAEDIIFGANGNIKFMIEGEGEMKEYDLTKTEITVIEFGERKFLKQKYTPRAKGKTEEGFHIMEEVYGSDKIRLLKYYPSTGKMGDNPVEFAFMKKEDPTATSLSDTQFLLWEKGLSNYFSDCADLKSMCEGGGIKNEKDDLIKAARIYSELCQ